MDGKGKPRQTRKPEAGPVKQDGGNEGTVGQKKQTAKPEGTRKTDPADLKPKRPKGTQEQDKPLGTKQPPAAQRQQRAESGGTISTVGSAMVKKPTTAERIDAPSTRDTVGKKPGKVDSTDKVVKGNEPRPKTLPVALPGGKRPPRKKTVGSRGTVGTISEGKRRTADRIEPQGTRDAKGVGVIKRMGKSPLRKPSPASSGKVLREPKLAAGAKPPGGQPENPKSHIGRDILIWIRELPVKECIFIILLWLPRYFYPWISEMHETNVHRLVDPYTFDVRRDDMLKIEMMIFAVKCITCVAVSAVADQFKLGHYIYLLLLFLYSFVPFVGLFSGMILSTDVYDTNKWFSVIVFMRCAMTLAFIMTPVQFTSIFAMKGNMSRLAHYCWTGLFAFFEFVNALIVFWVLPPPCGSLQFSSPAVWITLVVLMLVLFLIILGITAVDRIFKLDLMACLNICGVKRRSQTVVNTDKAISEDLKRRKFFWLMLLLLPVVFTTFGFATLERLAPSDEDEEWDRHEEMSSTSMFYVGRILGVAVMIVVIFLVNMALKVTTRTSVIRGDVLVLGLPHILLILGLLAIIGRVVFLMNSSELLPPPIIRTNFSLRLYFFNVLQTKEPACIESPRFSAVTLRHNKYVTRAIANIEAGTRVLLNVTSDTQKFSANLSIANPQKTNPLVISYAKSLQQIKVNIYNSELDLYEDPANLSLPRIAILDANRWPNYPYDYYEIEYQFKYESAMGPSYWDHNVSIVLPRLGVNRFQYWFPEKVGTWFVRVVYLQPNGVGRVEPSVNITVDKYVQYVIIGYAKDPGVAPHDTAFKLFKIADVKWPETETLPNKAELQDNGIIMLGMTLVGMSAGGIFVGVVYTFWVDPPYHKWQATILAVLWVVMACAAEAPRVKAVDIGMKVVVIMVAIQAVFTVIHFVISIMYFYTAEMNFRDGGA